MFNITLYILFTGSNPNSDSPCLELEFEWFGHPVSFPSDEQIEKFAHQSLTGMTLVSYYHHPSTHKNSQK